MPNIIVLKSWPEHFAPLLVGRKRAELRLNDRAFAEGDWLVLREYDPETERYSGRWAAALATHVLTDARMGLQPGYAMVSISVQQTGNNYSSVDFSIASTSLIARSKSNAV